MANTTRVLVVVGLLAFLLLLAYGLATWRSAGDTDGLVPAALRASSQSRSEVSRASDASNRELLFTELYKGGSSRGLVFSDKLVASNGTRVIMTGFMAPPLKPALDFFVLTRVPLALCPF